MSNENNVENNDHIHEIERLEEIAELGLTSDEVDNVLQDMASKAAEKLGLPMGMVTVVLDEAQYFAGSHGLEGWLAEIKGTPIEWSFCAHAVEEGKPFVVENAKQNEKVKDNPFVQEGAIQCYAGIPLITSKGNRLGTVCVAGPENRSFEDDELQELKQMADSTMAYLENRNDN